MLMVKKAVVTDMYSSKSNTIYLNCGERHEDMTDHCSCIHNFSRN